MVFTLFFHWSNAYNWKTGVLWHYNAVNSFESGMKGDALRCLDPKTQGFWNEMFCHSFIVP